LLRSAFKNAESKLKSSGIDYSNSGTCAISVFIFKNICYVANLGDSRAVLYRHAKEKLAVELSYDHKPIRPDEKERIQRCGGKIERLIHDGVPVGPYRVWADDEGPGIAMTRTYNNINIISLGDL
jgi:serine/threonine protein phosphatase PrpC